LTANVRRISDPLWFIGHSISREGRRPIISMDHLPASLMAIVDWQGVDNKFRIDSIFFDYLQRAPYNGRESKTVGISENLDALKNLAFFTKSKVICGVQAKTEVDKRDDPTPGMEDGQWTVITLVRPAKYRNEGEQFADITTRGIMQMRVTVAKQKMGDSNFDVWVDFDPRYNELEPVTYKHVELND
jgi:replicative DNA helicase